MHIVSGALHPVLPDSDVPCRVFVSFLWTVSAEPAQSDPTAEPTGGSPRNAGEVDGVPQAATYSSFRWGVGDLRRRDDSKEAEGQLHFVPETASDHTGTDLQVKEQVSEYLALDLMWRP